MSFETMVTLLDLAEEQGIDLNKMSVKDFKSFSKSVKL